MSVQAEITRLERKIEDLQHGIRVAVNESTGRADGLRHEIAALEERIEQLRPLAETPPLRGGAMVPCSGCGRAFWPESLEGGKCEFCLVSAKAGKKN